MKCCLDSIYCCIETLECDALTDRAAQKSHSKNRSEPNEDHREVFQNEGTSNYQAAQQERLDAFSIIGTMTRTTSQPS